MKNLKYYLIIIFLISKFCILEANESKYCLAPNSIDNNKKTAYKLKNSMEKYFKKNKLIFDKIIINKSIPKKQHGQRINPLWIMYGINLRTPRIGTSGAILPIGRIGETIPLYFEKETYIPLKTESFKEQQINYDIFTSSQEYEILKNFIESSDFMSEMRKFLDEAGISLNMPKKLFINKLRQIFQEVCLILKNEMISSDKKLNAYLNNQTFLQEKKLSYFLALEYLKFIEDFEKNTESLESYFSLSA